MDRASAGTITPHVGEAPLDFARAVYAFLATSRGSWSWRRPINRACRRCPPGSIQQTRTAPRAPASATDIPCWSRDEGVNPLRVRPAYISLPPSQIAGHDGIEALGGRRVSGDHECLALIDAHLLPGARVLVRLVTAVAPFCHQNPQAHARSQSGSAPAGLHPIRAIRGLPRSCRSGSKPVESSPGSPSPTRARRSRARSSNWRTRATRS